MITWIASVVLAAGITFVIGALWYSTVLFGAAAAALRPGGMASQSAAPLGSVMAMEFARCLFVSVTFAYFIHRLGIADIGDGLILAVVAWGGFQAFGLIGSVLHEGYPLRLYAIHMGDALAKAVANCLIITGLTSHFA